MECPFSLFGCPDVIRLRLIRTPYVKTSCTTMWQSGCKESESRIMSSESGRNYDDVHWLSAAELYQKMKGGGMSETLWKCDQMRAGRLYTSVMFDTREEAEQFMRKMQNVEPDQMFAIEAVDARQMWN